MKLAKILHHDRVATARIEGGQAHILGDWQTGDPIGIGFPAPGLSPHELGGGQDVVPLAEATLLAPIGPLSKLICIGINYRAHASEVAIDVPPQPALFTKFPDVLVGHEAPLIRPRVSEHFDFEGEISVVIGEPGHDIPLAEAMRHVFGYTIMMDGSMRDFQGHSLSAGKNFWRSGALGPWVMTADEIPDPRQLELTTRLNGTVMQNATADMMIYDIPTIISYVSRFTPLAPGDVIATGTPMGVGAQRKPPVWMQAGDRIEVEVAQIGTLANIVQNGD